MDCVREMSMEDFEVLWLAITNIEAQNALLQLTIQDWPNLKPNQRDKVHKNLHKQAYPKNFSAQVSTKDIFKQLVAATGGSSG